jgi:chromosome segregation ATPase
MMRSALQHVITMLRTQLKRDRKAAQNEKEDLIWELMDVTRRYKDMEENMQTTIKATELNKQAMESAIRQAERLEKEKQEFEAQVKELTRHNEELEQTNLDLKQNMQNMITATVLNKQGMKLITKQVEDLEEEIEDLTIHNEDLIVQVEDLKIRNEDLIQLKKKNLKQYVKNSESATTLHKQATESIRMQLKELERKKNAACAVQVGTLKNRLKKEPKRTFEDAFPIPTAPTSWDCVMEYEEIIHSTHHTTFNKGQNLGENISTHGKEMGWNEA